MAVPENQGFELAPLLVADALGEFEAENLRVEVEPMPLRDALAGVDAGDVDLVVGPVDGPYFDALHRGSRARLVLGGTLSPAPNAMTVDQTGLWVRTDALDEDGLSDLQLQPVGVPGGTRSAATYPIGQVLGQTEISLNEVALADTSSGEAAQQLIDGDLAAAWLDGGSWYRVAERRGVRAVRHAAGQRGRRRHDRRPPPPRPRPGRGAGLQRAIIRTINTHLTGDYRRNDDVVEALAGALDVDGEIAASSPRRSCSTGRCARARSGASRTRCWRSAASPTTCRSTARCWSTARWPPRPWAATTSRSPADPPEPGMISVA